MVETKKTPCVSRRRGFRNLTVLPINRPEQNQALLPVFAGLAAGFFTGFLAAGLAAGFFAGLAAGFSVLAFGSVSSSTLGSFLGEVVVASPGLGALFFLRAYLRADVGALIECDERSRQPLG